MKGLYKNFFHYLEKRSNLTYRELLSFQFEAENRDRLLKGFQSNLYHLFHFYRSVKLRFELAFFDQKVLKLVLSVRKPTDCFCHTSLGSE